MDEEKIGTVKVAEEVIAITAAVAASKVAGVASLGAGLSDAISFKRSAPKGIKIDYETDQVRIDIYVNVYYGHKIPEIAWNIQEQVKSEVENLTGEKVLAVNIHVQGVTFEEDAGTQEKEEERS